MELLTLINSNQGVMLLGLFALAIEGRVHLRHVFRRLEKLEDK